MEAISPSAQGVAYLRKIEENLSGDTLAKYFVVEKARQVAEGWIKVCPSVSRHIAVRGRYIEDTAGRYITGKGISQMMNIAAGLNTFPYRRKEAAKLLRYAELDYRKMLEYKKAQIAEFIERGIIERPSVDIMYVPVDLYKNGLGEVLSKMDWDWESPTIFVFEGVSYYLTMKNLKAVIDTVYKYAAVGSVFIMDYFPTRVESTEVFRKVMKQIAENGEPYYTCPTPENIRMLFKNFKIISDRDIVDIERDYCDDCRAVDFSAIVVAEKVPQSRAYLH